MEKKYISEIKEKYLEKQDEKRELLRLIESEDIKEYKKILGLDDESPLLFLFDEEIMYNILSTYNIPYDNTIALNMGYYLIPNSRFDSKRSLIKESDKQVIEKMKNKCIVVPSRIQYGDFSHILYDLESGAESMTDKADIIINLPSLKKFVDELPNYDERPPFYNPDFFNGDIKIQEVVRSQFFIKLMEEDSDEVLDYYRNENNSQTIENKAFEFIEKEKLINENKEKEFQLRKKLCIK